MMYQAEPMNVTEDNVYAVMLCYELEHVRDALLKKTTQVMTYTHIENRDILRDIAAAQGFDAEFEAFHEFADKTRFVNVGAVLEPGYIVLAAVHCGLWKARSAIQ